MKMIKYSSLHTANHEVVSVKGIVVLFVRMGDLRVHAWFRVVQNLAVYVLPWTKLIDRCTRAVFPSARKSSCGLLDRGEYIDAGNSQWGSHQN